MKKIGLVIITAAFVFSSGFFKKNEDGSYAADTAGLTKAANEMKAEAGALSEKTIEAAKKKAAAMKVPSEEIIADLSKTTEQLKQKMAGMDTATVMAYMGQYSTVFAETQKKITDLSTQVKDLGWKDKLGSKGKELKGQLATYTDQFNGLKDQCTVYVDKIKSFGIDPAAYGVDLSAYGL